MKKIFLIFAVIISVDCLYSQSFFRSHSEINPFQYKIVKKEYYKNAAVSSAHPLASLVGAAIMKDGGNAFDAAIAVQLALAVVYPGAGNIGGGGFLLALKADKTFFGLDYREAAPQAAFADMYLDSSKKVNPTLPRDGPYASGIPGTIAGLFETHKYAKLPFKKLIQPAIELAEFGFVLTASEAHSLNEERADFIKNSSSKNISFTAKEIWKEGDTLIQKDLAATLKRIQKKGQAGFYEGETAKLIVAEMNHSPLHKGIITLKDLKNYKAIYRTPLTFSYKDYNFISFAPPSSGGIILAQILNMIAPYNLSSKTIFSPDAVQLIIEAERRAFADRATYLGDPDFYKVPVKELIDPTYCHKRMADFIPNKAGNSQDIKSGTINESEQTTHLCIKDVEGNVLAITTTLNDGYGSKTVVSGAGFILNNEMDDFSAQAGVPNMYGATGGEANKIGPNKRMLSSMTPTIVLKNSSFYLTAGTPGGTTIPTTVLQVILNVIDFNLSMEEAINSPRFHHQWFPDVVLTESKFNAETVKALKDMGYKIIQRKAIGRAEGILISSKGFETVADIRGDDSVAGYE